jgi:hypothetical protein
LLRFSMTAGLLALLAALPAQAGKFYVGASAGETSTDDIELRDLEDGSMLTGDVDDSDTAVNGYDVSVLGILPIHPRVKLFARAGYYAWEREITIQNSAFGTFSEDDDGEDSVIGAGGSFRLGAGVDLRVEYEEFDVDDITIEVISGGLTWRF